MIDPKLTQRFTKDLEIKAKKEAYQMNVKIGEDIIPISVFPSVFPAQSDYSESSRSVFEAFGDLHGKKVADVGCGTGIESIVAVLAGADSVDTTDINPAAVACTRHNIAVNDLDKRIVVFEGDLFDSLSKDRAYDLIIVNLPIVNFKPEVMNAITEALYDPGLILHKRMFNDAKRYLSPEGEITFTHANLQSENTLNHEVDFEDMEKMIHEYGYEIIERKSREALGYKWVNYKIKLI